MATAARLPRSICGQLFDVAQQGRFLRIAERDGCSRRAGSSGSTDAVDIFCHVREIKIHHMTDPIDIDSTRSDVGRNKDANPAVAKIGERPIAVILGLVAEWPQHQFPPPPSGGRPDGAVFGTREHQRAIDSCVAQ